MSTAFRQNLEAGEQAGSRYVLRAPRTLPTGMTGLHQGGRAGSSLEFKEHREYEPGDDLRHIDWNAYARSDQLVVKLYHEEVTPHLDIVLDGSRSMALDGTAKTAAAAGLAAFCAAAASNAGFSHRVWLGTDGCTQLPGSNSRPSLWEPPTFDFPGSLADSFARRPPAFRPRGLRVLISDLFWMGDPLQVLAPCAERATAVIVIQVLALADIDPPERGNLRLVDVENEQLLELLVDAPAVARYQSALERHQKNWHDACRRCGGVFTVVTAESVVRDWRLDELVAAEVLQVM
jgi:uncharacterized protein (DUF58 family)